jgi:hypothetical protein
MKRSSLLTLLSLGLFACSEYDIKPNEVPEEVGDDTAVEPIEEIVEDLPECDPLIFPEMGISLDESCEIPPQIGSFSPVVKWTKASWNVDSSYVNIMMTPIVVPLDDDNGDGVVNADDIPDILVLTFSGGGGSYSILRAISGADGSEIWSVTNNHQITGALAAGDIDNDGLVEIIAPGTGGTVYAYENTGVLKWQATGLSSHMYNTSDAPAIADLDADGNPEIIIGRAVLTNTGQLSVSGGYGIGAPQSNVGATPSVADIDLDGYQEIVVGNAVYRYDGTALCNNGQTDGYTAIADFDSDMQAEVVVSSGAGQIRLQDTNCTVLWTAQIPGASSSYYGGPPTVADYDGDGLPEIGVAANNSYTVFDTDGSVLWQQPTQDQSSGNTGSAVFDFEGDGIAEAIYPDETSVWAFNGPDGGVKLNFSGHSSNTWTEYAVIADVDNDDAAEIVITHNNISGPHSGVTVIEDATDSWQSGRGIWNQHAYSITNVNEDGTIPAMPDPNWFSYNNFRSGDLVAATGGSQADLFSQVVFVCTDECDQGSLHVLVTVGNQGTLDVDVPTTLEIWALKADGTRTILDIAMINDPIPSGMQLEGIVFEITHPELASFVDIIAITDAAGLVSECNESNNESYFGFTLCH